MKTANKILIGIIGGSGLDDPKILKDFTSTQPQTPYGFPSSPITLGQIGGQPVAIIARHGSKHDLPPTLVPYRANIWALKKIGCSHVLATTACGSLRAKIKPGDLVFPDQFIDFTRLRPLTFFDYKVVHTSMASPFDAGLRRQLIEAADNLHFAYHPAGTVITIEGPRFSTKAESKLFRLWGADLINMSTVPEIVLANEIGLPYQSIAMSTDYDCWKTNEAPVTFDMVMERMHSNADKVKHLLIDVVSSFSP
ncbi:MAG: S-methyl-5'-thioadenosine phosphorylase [Candidatus Shapirobacteria bacterium]|jgi:5'-methylthioadenosine phosphorylase